MTSRERVTAAINLQPTDRVPLFFDAPFANTEILWRKAGLPEDSSARDDFFGYDACEMFIDSSMRFPERLIEDKEDEFTAQYKYGFVATKKKFMPGIHYHSHPLTDISDWPTLRPRWNACDEPARIHEISYFEPFVQWPSWVEAKRIFDRRYAGGRYIALFVYGHWESLWRLRGFNEAMMDLADNLEFVEDVFKSYTDFLLGVLECGISHGIKPDGLFLGDDHGSNLGPMFSPNLWRNLLLPEWQKIAQYLKDHDMQFIAHSCGNVNDLIPLYIESGVQALNPLQANVMDVVELKPKYGDKIAFVGNINTRTMHDRDTVLAEIRRKVPIAAKGGGYLFCSDHSIPEGVTLDLYLEMLELVRGIRV